MEKENSFFQDLVESAGHETRSYSGRAMYGKSCLGVVIPNGSLGQFIADIFEQMQYNLDAYDDDGVRERCEGAATAFRSMRTDDMGRDDMIVYFTDVAYEEDDDEEEEEEDDEEDDVD